MDKRTLSDCIEWDVVNWSKALKFWENSVDLDNKSFKCIELGGRRGGLSLWLVLKGNSVICSDYENPQVIASTLHKAYGVEHLITYQAIDATRIPFENHFDIVIFKSILGGISRNGNSHLNKVTIDEIYKSLKPGGKLLFAENLEASIIHRFFRKRLTRWGRYWNYLRTDEIDILFKNFTSVKYDTVGFFGAFGRTEVQRNLLGKLDSVIFDKMVSDKMKYIVFGVATK